MDENRILREYIRELKTNINDCNTRYEKISQIFKTAGLLFMEKQKILSFQKELSKLLFKTFDVSLSPLASCSLCVNNKIAYISGVCGHLALCIDCCEKLKGLRFDGNGEPWKDINNNKVICPICRNEDVPQRVYFQENTELNLNLINKQIAHEIEEYQMSLTKMKNIIDHINFDDLNDKPSLTIDIMQQYTEELLKLYADEDARVRNEEQDEYTNEHGEYANANEQEDEYANEQEGEYANEEEGEYANEQES